MKRSDRESKESHSLAFPEAAGEPAHLKGGDRSWLVNAILFQLAAALIIYPSYLGWKIIKPRINELRAARFAQTAILSMDRGNYSAAAAELEMASDLSRDSLPLLRAQALYYSHFQNPQGLVCWRRWDDSGRASREDKLKYTRLALASLRTDIARRVLKPLHQADPSDPEILSLVSEVFAQSGDLEQAIRAMQDAQTRDPQNLEYEIRLGVLELRSRSESVRTRGKGRLFGLISHLRGDRSQVARHLLLEGMLTPAEDRLLLTLIDVPKEAPRTSGEQLIHLAVELRKNPENLAPILEEFLPVPRTEEAILQAGQLLGELGLHRAVLLLVPKNGADRDRSMALLRLGALAALGEWEEMERLLSSPDLPLPVPMRALFKAGVAQSAGLDQRAPRLWQLAISSGAGNPHYLELLAVRAEGWGAPEAAIAAWEELLHNPIKSGQAARELLRLGAIWHHLPATVVALKRVVQQHPSEPRFRIQLALSQLMLEQEVDEARETLKELRSRYEDDPTYCVTSALVAVREGSPNAAIDWITRPSIQWSNAPTVWKVVQVAALGTGLQRVQARELARKIDLTRISPSEAELLAPWLPASSSAR